MIRNLKALGLAVMAVLALGAFLASGASAAVEFHSESAKTTLTAENENNQTFKAAGDTITCKQARFEATAEKVTTPELTVKWVETTDKEGEVGYGTCTFFGVKVTVLNHGCDYQFHATGTTDIKCPASAEEFITFKASFLGVSCDVKIAPQNGLSKVTYTNLGTTTTREVTVAANVTKIAYNATGSGCGKTGNQTDGVYEGNAVVTGEVDGTTTHTGIWVQ